MIIKASSYHPPYLLRNGHIGTIWSAFFRKKPKLNFQRERATTPDGDFIDLDWLRHGKRTVAVISHGLEGSSKSRYALWMAQACYDAGWDVLAWNMRSCSGELNKLPRFYHSGETEDFRFLLQHTATYDHVYLIGYSLGGNLTLKLLGELGNKAATYNIDGAVVFSVPLDLSGSCNRISSGINSMYSIYFLRKLKRKIKQKAQILPHHLSDTHLSRVNTLRDFDNIYTGPLHGFKSAADYYHENSSLRFLEDISVPTLIVNASNDPMLSARCFPVHSLNDHPYVYLEMPRYGGHVGFGYPNRKSYFWSEKRAVEFLSAIN